MRGGLTVALPKGRMGEKAYRAFEDAGFGCGPVEDCGRRLVFGDAARGLRYVWVKPSDVGIYVERGAADIGVAGKDVLLENRPDVYELLDLRIGACRLAVAAARGFREDPGSVLRVATKYPAVAEEHYAKKSREIDVIRLNGSIELAPLLGLSDVIVDIVETGTTLRENGLEPIETLADVSLRLIANKAAFKFKARLIGELRKGLTAQGEDRG